MVSQDNSIKYLEKLTPILLKLFKKYIYIHREREREEGTIPGLFYEAAITLISKLDKDIYIKKKKVTDQYN